LAGSAALAVPVPNASDLSKSVPHRPAAPPTPGVPHTSGRSPPRPSEPVPAAPHPPAVCDSAHASATRSTHWGRPSSPGTSGPPDDEPSPAPTGPNASTAWTRSPERRRRPLAPGPPWSLATPWGSVRISRSSRRIRFSCRSRRNSSRSAVTSPSLRSPASSSALPTQALRVPWAILSSRAICAMARAELWTRGSASRHHGLLSEAVASSVRVSTEPAQVQATPGRAVAPQARGI
jgi:hypothetical protein